MTDYDFSTLNDKEFEEITKDLLNAEYELKLQSFRSGRDKGIDLRYSSIKNNNSIVVQAKHYLKSGYSLLKSKIKNEELPKLPDLNPERYILVTSVDLTASQKDELKSILHPYVATSNDILGQKDLNDLLSNNKKIETDYYKLWLSSTNVLQTILNNAVEGRTKYFLTHLKEKIKYYVVTKKIEEANEILKNEKILLITGQPGIGKTSLAEIILFDRAKNDFKVHKVENIKEAEDVISLDDNEPQIFYFDDFLGANYTEIINSHKTETQLTSFVERIQNTPNKYIILTTRTVILNYAKERYDKISHSGLNNRQFELKLNDYTKYEKALILYNHFFHKGVDERLYDVILSKKFYIDIINHKNYTPRIIEFISDSSRISEFDKTEYHQFILNNLNNPKEIWRYSFGNQIGYSDRCFLLTLFSLGNEVTESTLQNAFEARLLFEKTNHNQIIKTNQFNESIKILLNGFIISILYNYIKFSERKYKFINPSLADFLINYLAESYSERKSLITSAIYSTQLSRLDPRKSIIPLEIELQKVIRDKINNKEFQDLPDFSNDNCSKALSVLTIFCPLVNTDKLLHLYLSNLNFDIEWNYWIFIDINTTLKKIEDSPISYEYVKLNFIKFIEKMMKSIDSEIYVDDILSLFEKYDYDYKAYLRNSEGAEKITELIEAIVYKFEEEIKENISGDVKELNDVEIAYEEVFGLKENLINNLSFDNIIRDDFDLSIDETYWEEKFVENIAKEERREYDREEYIYEASLDYEIEGDIDVMIDDLFE